MSRVGAAERLRAELQRLRLSAGRPTYRELVGYADEWLTAQDAACRARQRQVQRAGVRPVVVRPPRVGMSTIAENLQGKRRSMRWVVVRYVVIGCRSAAAANGLPVDERFDPAWWEPLWRAQADDEDDQPDPPGDPHCLIAAGAGWRQAVTIDLAA